MSGRTPIRKCPCGCGKTEYDLGVYRGFHLYQKPYSEGWWVYAEKIEPKDELDQLLIPRAQHHSESFFEVSEPPYIVVETDDLEGHYLKLAEKKLIEQIDTFWVRKETLIMKAKEGVFKVEPRED